MYGGIIVFSFDYHKLAFQNKKLHAQAMQLLYVQQEKILHQLIEPFFKVLDKLVFKRINQGKP